MDKKRNFRRILHYVKPYWFSIMMNIVFNILAIVFSLFSFSMIVPFLNLLFNPENLTTVKPEFALDTDTLLAMLDYYVSYIIILKGQSTALIFICLLLVIAFFLRNITTYFALYFMVGARAGTIKDIRNDLYRKIMILPLSFYSHHKKGDIMARITTDVQEIEVSIISYLDTFIKSPITILAYFAYMLGVSWRLTLFVLILLPIGGLIIGAIGKSLKKDSLDGQNRFAGMLATIEETIGGLRIIKAFNAIDYSSEKFNEQNGLYTRVIKFVNRKRDLSSPMSEFMSSIIISIVVWFGATLILDAAATPGAEPSITAANFIAYIVVFSQIISPAKSFSQGFYSLQKGMASADRIFEVLDAEEVIVEKQDALELPDFNDSIIYNNVSFHYNEVDVLHNINLTIPKGKMIALVGESGGGKSTLVDLLPRFYDVSAGHILIDGTDIRDFKISDVRGLMGIVSQESILFNDTVFNNIAFGLEHATREAVIEAAKIANAHDFIMEMEDGYDTVIGDRGMNLSGGQRQRISIARAVLKNPPILILDEATSSLDTESERLVQEALAKVMTNRTSIVIAHRLSTIQNADEILVMVKGQIVERGKHEELIEKGGVYKRLTDLQSFNN
ncbi:MAG: ABC transporter ATP-binding protein/permease [Bacteroidales bacterium]|nr:ABC transporter ATP-binding protein/permease [Bacteroidales bacterium]